MKTKQTRLKLASTAAVAASFVMGTAVHAADNPFGLQKLEGGYQLAQADTKAGTDKAKDGKCGEAKCGADKKAAAEKKKDGKCGADKKTATSKKKDAACGASKGKEGACGNMK